MDQRVWRGQNFLRRFRASAGGRREGMIPDTMLLDRIVTRLA
jgi:hypothetical protein